jgi:hypothetical protein
MSMLRNLAGFAVAGAVLLATVAPGLAKGPPTPLTDWPCDTPFAGPLEAKMLRLGAGELFAPAGAWKADPAAYRLVNFLTAGENSPAMGQREIEDFVENNGPLKPETSLLVVSGMVERGNKLRMILLDGIKQQIIKSHVLAVAIDENSAQLAAAKARTDARHTEPATLSETRRQNLDMLDDADDMAAHLCHRLVYDETKLKSLAATLRAHTQ